MNILKSFLKKAKKLLFGKEKLALIALMISFMYFSKASYGIPSIKFSYFLAALSKNYLSEIYVSSNSLKFKGSNSNWYQTDRSLLSEKQLNEMMIGYPNVQILRSESILSSFNRSSFLIYGLALLVLVQSMRLLKQFLNYGSYKPEIFASSKIKFSDICGHETAKKEMSQIIEYFNSTEKFQKIGARIRKGVLLYGPTGTGKTLLGKALAGETNLPFIYCSGSEFNEIYMGYGQRKIRDLFSLARKNSPCIIFIDEIDGLGQRGSGNFSAYGNQEYTNTINQLLSEMDGFLENTAIIIVAATNKINLVDEALMRSGRFDMKIKVEPPKNDHERKELLKHFLIKKKINPQITESLNGIAQKLKEFSGADIENFINECAYSAVSKQRERIELEDFQEAFEKFHI